jgi:hypothetical protein
MNRRYLQKVDCVLPGHLTSEERSECEYGLTHHVGRELAVGELCLVLEELLLGADSVDGHLNTAREGVREPPYEAFTPMALHSFLHPTDGEVARRRSLTVLRRQENRDAVTDVAG